jgi:U3 small nucleolar RNA-associated protein 6
LWLEYASLETLYIFKILERRRVLGLDQKAQEDKTAEGEDFGDQNEIILPTITEDELQEKPEGELVSDSSLADISKNAALNGAIPMMVYTSATTARPDDILLLVGFYDMFLSFFPAVPFINSMLDTIKNDLGKFPGRGYTLLVQIKDCARGMSPQDQKFPSVVREMMKLASAISTLSVDNRKECCVGLLKFIHELSEKPELEENLREVLKIFEKRVMKLT